MLHLLGGALGGGQGVALEDRRLDGLGGVLALELVLDLGRRIELRAVRATNLLEQRCVYLDRLEDFLLLADFRRQIALQRA